MNEYKQPVYHHMDPNDYNSYYNSYDNSNLNLLPQMHYYTNQHSNKSNNSNSTYISSTTTKSSNTISSVTSHSHSQSTQQPIAPIHYHPYSMIQRSSTPNINIIELDQMVNELSNTNTNKNKHKPSYTPILRNNINNNNINNNNMKHLRQNSRSVELKSFSGDIRAYNTWIACIQNNNNDKIFFYTLYPKLCEYFIDIVKTQRYPTQNDLRNVFIRHGAIANKYKNDNNTYLSIDRIHFISFWKWFKQCCQIIKELRFLWVNNNNNTTNNNNNNEKKGNKTKGLNFFCQRMECETNLLQCVEGTFGLRLSSTVCGGIVLSYVENRYNDIQHKLQCKHVILVRQKIGMYKCNNKILSLHDIIRNFVKLKFLYTPNGSISKNKIF